MPRHDATDSPDRDRPIPIVPVSDDTITERAARIADGLARTKARLLRMKAVIEHDIEAHHSRQPR